MIKHFAAVAMTVSIILILTSCNNISSSGPEDALNNYLDASLKGRHAEAYNYVSSEDKAVKSLNDYIVENNDQDNPFASLFIDHTSYNIVSVTKMKERATAEVEITLPDHTVIFSNILGTAFKSAFGGGEYQKEIEETLLKKYKGGNTLPLRTTKETFQLVKEQEGWKVSLDWKTEKIEREKQAKIKSLLSEASKLKESKKLHGALESYAQVLELDSEMVEAKKGIEETKKEIEIFEEKQAYIKNIVLYDLSAKYYTTYLDKKVPGVEFKLKNRGDRALKKVEVTIYFKDATESIIAEEIYHPIFVSEYSFVGNNKPLKPNYIWQLERDKFYNAKSVPSEWRAGAVAAKITNIEFMD